MDTTLSKIDKDLIELLNILEDEDQTEALFYPEHTLDDLESLIRTKSANGDLDFNILKLANCVVVKGQKKIICELAAGNEVLGVHSNLRFSASGRR